MLLISVKNFVTPNTMKRVLKIMFDFFIDRGTSATCLLQCITLSDKSIT